MADGAETPDADALRLSPRVLVSPLTERDQNDEVLAKGVGAFYGDEMAFAVYRRAKAIVIEHDLFLLKQLSQVGDAKHLTICNLWRIERSPGADFKLFMRELTTGQWKRVRSLDSRDWPSFRLLPLSKERSPRYWRGVCERVLEMACDAAAQLEFPGFPKQRINLREARDRLEWHYLGRPTGNVVNAAWKNGILHPAGMSQGAKAIRAAFFEHFVEKELLSTALLVDYKEVSFSFYLKLAMHRNTVLRIAAERRNLVPMLPHLSPKIWNRDDLFSRKLWLRGERNTTIIDRSSSRLKSFTSSTAWRWLSRAPVTVVSTWAFKANGDEMAIKLLALANVTAKVPVMAVRKYLSQMYPLFRGLIEGDMDPHQVQFMDPIPLDSVVRLVRVYLHQAAHLWEKSGYKAVRAWLEDQNLDQDARSILDYLRGEGIARGFPQKNSTWPSLMELARDWHARIRIEAMRQDEANARRNSWTTALPQREIDGFTFTPLTSAWELMQEGYDMDHCVGWGGYASACKAGRSRIFAVQGNASQRGTLELGINKKKVTVVQLQGHHNITRTISDFPAMERAAAKLAVMYQQAVTASKKGRVAKMVEHMRRVA